MLLGSQGAPFYRVAKTSIVNTLHPAEECVFKLFYADNEHG